MTGPAGPVGVLLSYGAYLPRLAARSEEGI